MKFLDRNILPKFQERLDLAASDLNGMEDTITEAINELAGRLYILNNVIPEEDRSKYASDTSSALLNTLATIKEDLKTVEDSVANITGTFDTQFKELSDKYMELEKRLNTLDDAAARKEDVAVIYKRTSE